MRIGPVSLFQRMHSNGTPINSYSLIALHWPWSLTWRFGVSWSPWNKYSRSSFMRTHIGRGFNFSAGLSLWKLGNINIQTQPNMAKKG